MKVFVTGATGLLGSGAVRACVAAGHEVTGLTSREAGRRAIEALGARALVGDMRAADRYREALGEADAIIHAAAAFPDKIRYSAADVAEFMGSDSDAIDALVSVMSPKCRAFVMSSGAYSYGDTGPTPADEDRSTAQHYAIMGKKLETEAKLLALAKAGKVPGMVVRPGMVCGDGSLWGKLYIEPMRKKKRAMIPGNGKNIVSFVHAADGGEAYRTLIERGKIGEIYNVADDEPATLGDVVRAQAVALGAPPPYSVPGWLVRTVAGPWGAPATLGNAAISNRKLRALGWEPKCKTYRETVVAVAESLR
jgi:nucleoside-diphosphate-sugar epimerase